MDLPDDEDLLLMPEVAKLARMPVNTLRYMRKRGEGPEGFRLGKRVVFRRGKVRAWLKAIEDSQAEQGAA